jgi:hypothetical protein
MSGDAVGKALREASKAMRAAMVKIGGAGGVCVAADGYIDTSSMDDDAVAAAAVAAFLRALPAEFQALVPFDSCNVDPVFFAEAWEMLAAAVTRAASENTP